MKSGELWIFARHMWRLSDVAPVAIGLQRSFGLSVCLVLAGLWLGRRQIMPDAVLAQQLMSCAGDWESNRLGPLRQLRDTAAERPLWAEWRRLLLEAELEAERLLIEELQLLVSERPLPATDADSGDAWLLLLVPDVAHCEALSEGLARLHQLCARLP